MIGCEHGWTPFGEGPNAWRECMFCGVPEYRCTSTNRGDRCDLRAGHPGKHFHSESFTWAQLDGPVR